ncbi:MAG: tetratricopeptide repeat protein, partial [Chloroflexota bacterium]
IPLAPITDANLVLPTIAYTLGVLDVGPQTSLERLRVFLRDKQTLLVLDNFEQILDAAAQIAELLAVCPWLKLLATSRAPLRIRQERQFPVSSLALPDLSRLPDVESITGYSAVTLFIERAQAVKPDFSLTEENAPTVAALCTRLDGLPLAIELISARVKLLSPAALLERLHGRLMLQSDGLRDIEPRHRTLNAAIDWSFQLLNAEEQALFRRLGIFVGGWRLDAAEIVCMENLKLNLLDGMASLLDKNLVKQDTRADGVPRFTMLETIREYAREQLAISGELERLQQQHAAYFLSLVENPPPDMNSVQTALWWDRLELEHSNFRAALTWGHSEAGVETELRLALALNDFWRLHGHLSEGGDWLTDALEQQVRDASGTLSEAARRLRASALATLTALQQWLGNLNAAQPTQEESLALFRELGDKEAVADALSSYGMLFVLRGDHEQASIYLNESMALWRELENRFGIGITLLFLGNLAYSQGYIARAGTLWEEALVLYRKEGALWVISILLAQLAMVALEQGDYRLAEAQLMESLTVLRDMDERWQIVQTLEVFASLAETLGRQSEEMQANLHRSARIFGAAEKLRERLAAPVFPFQRHFNERGITSLRSQLNDTTFATCWAEGRAMPLDQVVAYALSQAI